MKYTVVSSAEFTYPDLFEYPSASASIAVFAARLADREVTLPAINSVFAVLWRIGQEFGGAA